MTLSTPLPQVFLNTMMANVMDIEVKMPPQNSGLKEIVVSNLLINPSAKR
jgi:hypothetical protein